MKAGQAVGFPRHPHGYFVDIGDLDATVADEWAGLRQFDGPVDALGMDDGVARQRVVPPVSRTPSTDTVLAAPTGFPESTIAGPIRSNRLSQRSISTLVSLGVLD